MAVRNFSGSSQWIQLALGTLEGIQSGAITVATIAKIASNSSYRPVLTFDASTTNTRRSVARYSSNNLGFDSSGGEFSAALSWQIADDWCLIAWTKTAGSQDIRAHKYVYGTDTWTHTDGGSAGDDGTALHNVKIGQWYDASDFFSGRIAVIGAWKSALSDVALEALTDALADWVDASPDALWPLNQASTATAVEDITGNGADQTSLTGTTVVTGDDPPGFDFSLGAGAITGEGASTAPAATAAGTGTVEVAGTGEATASAATSAAAGTAAASGTSDATVPAGVATGTGGVVVSGSGASTAPAGVAAGTGGVGSVPIAGSSASVAPIAVVAGAGAVAVSGSSAAVVPAGVAAGAGVVGELPAMVDLNVTIGTMRDGALATVGTMRATAFAVAGMAATTTVGPMRDTITVGSMRE